jgi:hypothetical protein
MNILFTNFCIDKGTGTEMFLFDLCAQLVRLGHSCAVYTTRHGALVDRFFAIGVPVIDDLGRVPWVPDVLHCQHSMETLRAISSFPSVPALYLCHDATAWYDKCPPFPSVQRCLAVDTYVRQRASRDVGLPENAIGLAFNAVDERRFTLVNTFDYGSKPRKALLFHSNLTGEEFKLAIQRACAHFGIELEEAGHGGKKLFAHPEEELPRYDLVFAKGRCAIEALASGCSVILAGGEGLGPLITPANFHALRAANFGRSLLRAEHAQEYLIDQIRQIQSQQALDVTKLVRLHSSLPRLAEFFLSEYHSLLGGQKEESFILRTCIAYVLSIQSATNAWELAVHYQVRSWGFRDRMRTFVALAKARLKRFVFRQDPGTLN